MKTRQLNKKLVLKKQRIAHLNLQEMIRIQGGLPQTHPLAFTCAGETCVSSCEPSKANCVC